MTKTVFLIVGPTASGKSQFSIDLAKKIKENTVKIVIQINGRKRGLIEANRNISEENLFEIINKDETLTKYLKYKTTKKKIYIKNKLINIII